MEAKSNSYLPKIRVEKTNTFRDDIRVILAGLLICIIFIVTPFYIAKQISKKMNEPELQQPKD